MGEALKTLLKHASTPNFFGAIVAAGFLYGQWAIQQTFREGQREIARSIEIHSSILVGLQMQLLADDEADFHQLRLSLEDIRAQLRGRE